MQYLLALTLLLAPTYAVRFGFFGMPTNLLMVWLFLVWFIFAVWLILRHEVFAFFLWLRSELFTFHFSLATLFLLAGIASLFVGGFSQEKLGQFIVLFLQPIGTFLIARYVLASSQGLRIKDKGMFINATLLFVAASGIYAIVQYLTLFGIPPAWWGNAQEPKRALSFFLHPNFYALFVTPLLAFLLPQLGYRLQVTGERKEFKLYPLPSNLYPLFAWFLGAIGLFLSLSRGGWLGLAVAIGVYVLVAGNRKIMKSALVASALIVLIVISVPNFRYRVLLPFQGEKSSVARFSLWNTGWKMVQDSPVQGKGLLGFSNNWYAYNTDPGLQHYPAPHNIALNFWVDTGLLGLLLFFSLLALAIWRGIKNKSDAVRFGLALACIALLVHGLIDIPYLKNDLALVFWMLFAFI